MAKYVAQLDCPHCKTSRAGMTGNQLIQTDKGLRAPLVCPHCAEIVVVECQATRTFFQTQWRGDEVWNLDANGHLSRGWLQYPQSPTRRNVPASLSPRIEQVYEEAIDNLNRGKFETAVLLCGKVLDLSTKQMDQSWKLERRLKQLAADGKITEDMSDWAEEIRLDRNTAIHEDEDFSEGDAEEILAFTEAFLTYVFTLPEMIKSRRQARETDELTS